MAKKITIRVNRPDGSFLKEWSNAKFIGFTKQLNAGLGSCMIELGEQMDYSGNDLSLNNEVQVLISDKDTIGEDDRQKLIYSGYISSYVPWIDGKREGIYVYLLGYYTKLSQDIWKNGTTTTFDYNSIGATDIGTVVKSVMDRYIAEITDGRLGYTEETIKITSTTTTFKFELLTYREAIDTLKNMALAGWFWYVDELGLVYFKSKPTTATHEFVLGKHFNKVRVERSIEKVKNIVYFYNDTPDPKLLKKYSDVSSIADYGERAVKVVNSRVQTADADKIADGFIDDYKVPHIKVIAEILDNNEDTNFGYDIESINPGDTCTFFGFDESLADIFKENMLITKVDYQLDKVTITIEPLEAGIIKRAEAISERVDALEREGVPGTYST